jgi:hypothetical protein
LLRTTLPCTLLYREQVENHGEIRPAFAFPDICYIASPYLGSRAAEHCDKAALRLFNDEFFLQFNGALLCQVKPSFRNTRVLKDEPSLVLCIKLYLPNASQVIFAFLNHGKQRLNS